MFLKVDLLPIMLLSILLSSCQGFGMESAVGGTRNPGTGFFKKSKKRSETRFGPLLMSSGRLVLFSGESEHFFFRRKCETFMAVPKSMANGSFRLIAVRVL